VTFVKTINVDKNNERVYGKFLLNAENAYNIYDDRSGATYRAEIVYGGACAEVT